MELLLRKLNSKGKHNKTNNIAKLKNKTNKINIKTVTSTLIRY